MPRQVPWNPGHRPLPDPKKTKTPFTRLVTADLERIGMYVSRFPYSDAEIARVANMGLSPEINEENILLSLQRDEARVAINLTALTAEELDIFESAIQYAITQARPIVLERDRVAKEAYENGDGTYRRLHRGSPKISFVARSKPADDKIVRE